MLIPPINQVISHFSNEFDLIRPHSCSYGQNNGNFIIGNRLDNAVNGLQAVIEKLIKGQ